MKLYLDTSTSTCQLKLDDHHYTWEAGRNLAEGLHQFIYEKLQENHQSWQDLSVLTFFSGPGSFTGLRIGATLVNTLADQLQIPLYDHHGQRHQVIIPNYAQPAHISQPKK